MRRSAEASLLEYLMVKDAQRGVMDVVIELSRLDQRLADIGEWTPLPDPLPTNDFSVPETVAEHVVSTIKMIRNEYFREVISLLRSAAEQTDLALWLNFMQEEDQG